HLLPHPVDLVDEALEGEAEHHRAAQHAVEGVEGDVRVAQVRAAGRLQVGVGRPVGEDGRELAVRGPCHGCTSTLPFARRSASASAPWLGLRRRGGATTPGARRLVLTRNAVCAIIRWSGRTARPSACQSRTSDSQARGSVKPPRSRSASTSSDSCGVVATYPMKTPPGTSARSTRSSTSHGVSMSKTIRSKPVSSQSATSPTRSVQAGGDPPNTAATLRRAISAKSARSSYEYTRPAGPAARSSEQVRAPDPAPASRTL